MKVERLRVVKYHMEPKFGLSLVPSGAIPPPRAQCGEVHNLIKALSRRKTWISGAHSGNFEVVAKHFSYIIDLLHNYSALSESKKTNKLGVAVFLSWPKYTRNSFLIYWLIVLITDIDMVSLRPITNWMLVAWVRKPRRLKLFLKLIY